MADVAWISEMLRVWNTFDGERAASYFAPDGVWEDVALGTRHEGRDPIAHMMSVTTPEFSSDAQFELLGAVADETGYGVEWRWSGTHGASGRPFDVRGASIGRLRDGQIVHHVDYWNPAHLSGQIGGELA